MKHRAPILLVLGLLLCGFGSCSHFIQADTEARARARQMREECTALEQRIITFEEEHSFGDAVSLQWVSTAGGLTTRGNPEALHVQLNKLGRNLAAQSSRPNLPWVFGVLESNGVNAVSGPGGYVFVSEGLLERVDNEAQLAGVLAHEIAHITGRHALHEYQDYLVGQCESAAKAEESSAVGELATDMVSEAVASERKTLENDLGSLASVLPPSALRDVFSRASSQVAGFDFDQAGQPFIRAVTQGVIERLNRKGFRPEDEYAADLEAVDLMAAAGYAPEAYVDFLSRLPERGGLFTPHPPKGKRQAALRMHLTQLRTLATEPGFTTPVDVSSTQVIPLRDELRRRSTPSSPR